MLKPYLVELKVTAVVMAENMLQAHIVAERCSSEILFDSELSSESAILIESIDHLTRLEPDWTNECIPYGGDGETRLKDLLSVASQVTDTITRDLFSTNQT